MRSARRLATALARLIVVALVPIATSAQGASPTAIDVRTDLIGAPVFAADGPEVGEVVDVTLDTEAHPDSVRIAVGAFLGMGSHEIELQDGQFTVLRGAIVLDVAAEALESLPPP